MIDNCSLHDSTITVVVSLLPSVNFLRVKTAMFCVCEEAAAAAAVVVGCHGDAECLAGDQWRRRLVKVPQVLEDVAVLVGLQASRRSPVQRTLIHSPTAEVESRINNATFYYSR